MPVKNKTKSINNSRSEVIKFVDDLNNRMIRHGEYKDDAVVVVSAAELDELLRVYKKFMKLKPME